MPRDRVRSRGHRREHRGRRADRGRPGFVTDTLGLLLIVMVVTAAVQDRDGAKPALLQGLPGCTRVRFVFTDGAFAGRLLDWAQTRLRRHPAGGRRAHLRLAHRAPPPGDYERDPAITEALIRWAAINTITRRIARGGPATRQQRRTFNTAS